MKRKCKNLIVFLSGIAIWVSSCFGTIKVLFPVANSIREETKIYCSATVKDDFTEDKILVVLNNQASLEDKEYTAKDFSKIGCLSVKDFSRVGREKIKAGNSNAMNPAKFNRILSLTIPKQAKQAVLDKIKELEKMEIILSAEPNFSDGELSGVPNHEKWAEQWALNMISMPAAWDFRTDASNVKIGILDSGIDRSHPDLIDLSIEGEDFTTEDWYNKAPWLDKNGHGTFIAGIIGASGNDKKGITGICWKSSLVSLKIDEDMVHIPRENVLAAISYAEETGIQILNMSFTFPYVEENYSLLQAIEAYPGLIVCAAGNKNNGDSEESRNNDNHPVIPGNSNADNVITVGNSSIGDRIFNTSHYGKNSVDIFAPGEGIYSLLLNGRYGTWNGTSFSAPIVAGVAALLLAKYPTLTPAQLKQYIVQNVDTIYDEEGDSVFEDYCISGGRLNAYKVFQYADSVHMHTFSGLYEAFDIDMHKKFCSSCDTPVIEEHNWEYQSEGTVAHRKICTGCNYSYHIIESHTFKYKFGNINNHIKYCTDCDYETTGKHIWIKQDSTTWYCKTCNFKTLLQPISPIASEPIKQELMLQAALSPTGIVEYNGVTLYFENGNCYLLVAEGTDVQAELAKLYYDNILVLTE